MNKITWTKTVKTFCIIWTGFMDGVRIQIQKNEGSEEYAVRKGGQFVQICWSLAEAKKVAI